MDGLGGMGLAAKIAMAFGKKKKPKNEDEGDWQGGDGGEAEIDPTSVRPGDAAAPPDPGGYLEQYHFGPTVWHSYNGEDLYGSAAIDKFNRYASDPIPGGSGGGGSDFGRYDG